MFLFIAALHFAADYFNRKIRAPEFTLPAANTIVGTDSYGFVVIIQFQNLFRAKFNADSAAFAPWRLDVVGLKFIFYHACIIKNYSKMEIDKNNSQAFMIFTSMQQGLIASEFIVLSF